MREQERGRERKREEERGRDRKRPKEDIMRFIVC